MKRKPFKTVESLELCFSFYFPLMLINSTNMPQRGYKKDDDSRYHLQRVIRVLDMFYVFILCKAGRHKLGAMYPLLISADYSDSLGRKAFLSLSFIIFVTGKLIPVCALLTIKKLNGSCGGVMRGKL